MSQNTTEIAYQRVTEAKLDPHPLPVEWVIDGDPCTTALVLWESSDGKQASGIWECTPGTFHWFHTDETATIVAGRATITPERGQPFEIKAGDVVFFPEKAKTLWQVHETVRKSFHLHASKGIPF